MRLIDLRDYIESELAISRFRDYSPNGVQIEGCQVITRLATAVTASMAVLEAATAWGADAILVHHGYFWRSEDAAISGIKKKRVSHLLKHDVSLLAYHLPLDAHPVWGNNACLGKRLGFLEKGRFGDQDIAMVGELEQPKPLQQLGVDIAQALNREPVLIGEPTRMIRRIAWCSGGGQGYFEQAISHGVDAFLTGEISEQNVHVAQETGVAFISAGHHATERYGVQALGEHLASRFGLEYRFFDQDIQV